MNELKLIANLELENGTKTTSSITLNSGSLQGVIEQCEGVINDAFSIASNISVVDDSSTEEKGNALENLNAIDFAVVNGKWFEGEHLQVDFELNTNIAQDKEHKLLTTIIKNEGFNFVSNGECYAILKEEFNNEVINLFENKHSDHADEDGDVDLSLLTNTIFDDLLLEIISSKSDDVILGIDNIYSICREQFSDELYDYIIDNLINEWC